MTSQPAWAIRVKSIKGYIGYLWFESGSETPSHRRGCTTALFATRREAHEALPRVRGPAEHGRFPDARVERVLVTIRPARWKRER
mgnify:CR=1 FL=1